MLVLKNKILEKDPISAKLFYLIFKEKVQGTKSCNKEKFELVKEAQLNYFSISNLAKYLLKHKDFNDQRKIASKKNNFMFIKSITQGKGSHTNVAEPKIEEIV